MNIKEKFFPNKAEYEKGFEDGMAEKDKQLISIRRAELEDCKNHYEEELEKKETEILRLNVKLKAWQDTHDQVEKDKIQNRKDKSKNKREWNKIILLKDDILKEITRISNNQVEPLQSIGNLIAEAEGEFMQLEESK